MTKGQRGWVYGGLASMTLAAVVASAQPASAQTVKVQTTQKNTGKDAKKKDLNNPAAKPPVSGGSTTVKPGNSVTVNPVQKVGGLSHITIAPPGTWAMYPLSSLYTNNSSPFVPSPYGNPYVNGNPYLNNPMPYAYYANPYLNNSPIALSPLPYNNLYPSPYYNTLYSNYSPNPLLNANPAFQQYNQFSPYSQMNNPYLYYPQQTFPFVDGFGGTIGSGLLYRGLGY